MENPSPERIARTWDCYQNAVMWRDIEDAEFWWNELQEILGAKPKP